MRAFSIGTFPLPQILGYPDNYIGFSTPVASEIESFEFADSWSGTIADVNYPDTYTGFATPIASEVDGFENADSWPGT